MKTAILIIMWYHGVTSQPVPAYQCEYMADQARANNSDGAIGAFCIWEDKK